MGKRINNLDVLRRNTLPCNSVLKFTLKFGDLFMLLWWEILVSWKSIKMHTK